MHGAVLRSANVDALQLVVACTLRSTSSPAFAGRLGASPILGGGVGTWAATTQIAGAVVPTGALVVDINVQKVQHPTGGIVGEIRARDGDVVKLGDVVVRLDETVTRANLAIVSKGLESYRRARRGSKLSATAQM